MPPLYERLQVLKGHRTLPRQLGHTDRAVFRKYIDSLLPMAKRIEQLAPAIAGFSQPNAEYPWQDPSSGEIFTPAAFDFKELGPMRGAQLQKLDRLIRALLRVIN